MSFTGPDVYQGARYYGDYSENMMGSRLTENFGEHAYAPVESLDMFDQMMSERGYHAEDFAEVSEFPRKRWQGSEAVSEFGPEQSKNARFAESTTGRWEHDAITTAPAVTSGGFTEFSELPERTQETYDYGYDQDEEVKHDSAEADMYSPPIGYWDPSSDFSTQEYSIKRMINNRNNMFDMFSHIEYRLAEGSKTKWTLGKEWGEDGKNTPYAYSGSPFGADRVINRIWLMDASHNSVTSQTLHFSMPNSLTKTEMLKPIIPTLVRTHEEGPTHVILRPGEKLRVPMLLWFRDVTSRRSPVIARHPTVDEHKLRSELMNTSNMKERGYVKNLAAGNSILLDYIRDKIDSEGYADRLEYVPKEGYYKIPINEAESFIQLWKKDQSRDLTVGHLYNLTVRPNRAVRSPKDSPSFHEDPFQDRAEIMSSITEWSLGDEAEEKAFYNKTIREKPITVYWNIRVELVPATGERH